VKNIKFLRGEHNKETMRNIYQQRRMTSPPRRLSGLVLWLGRRTPKAHSLQESEY